MPQGFIDRWLQAHCGGHIHFWRITLYGWNAMHGALNIRIGRGWFCLKPPTKCFGAWWPAYCYWSPDATPNSPRAKHYWPRPCRHVWAVDKFLVLMRAHEGLRCAKCGLIK